MADKDGDSDEACTLRRLQAGGLAVQTTLSAPKANAAAAEADSIGEG
jgi:hypothetical protein